MKRKRRGRIVGKAGREEFRKGEKDTAEGPGHGDRPPPSLSLPLTPSKIKETIFFPSLPLLNGVANIHYTQRQ